jgi:hypothetical protein
MQKGKQESDQLCVEQKRRWMMEGKEKKMECEEEKGIYSHDMKASRPHSISSTTSSQGRSRVRRSRDCCFFRQGREALPCKQVSSDRTSLTSRPTEERLAYKEIWHFLA